MSELSSNLGSGGREEGWEKKDGRGRRLRGGLIYGNSVARLKAHTAACCEQRGTGVGKNMDETRADPEEIFDLRFRAQDEARTALSPLLLFYRGSLLIHSHREIICILNAHEIKGIALFSRIC